MSTNSLLGSPIVLSTMLEMRCAPVCYSTERVYDLMKLRPGTIVYCRALHVLNCLYVVMACRNKLSLILYSCLFWYTLLYTTALSRICQR